jgi:hypothetical protein
MPEIIELYNLSETIQFRAEQDAITYLESTNDRTIGLANQLEDEERSSYLAAHILLLRRINIEEPEFITAPDYQRFMDELDLPPIGNGLYAELISDRRYAIYGQELALTVAQQAEGIYSLCRSALTLALNEKDIRNLQFRLDSIYYLMGEEQKARMRAAIANSNIPVTVY